MRTGIMLCYPFSEKRLSTWTNGFIIQPKLNGERCRAIIEDNGRVLLFSSEGNQIPYLQHINQDLKNTGLKNIELDGEVYLHGMDRETIHGIVSRKVNPHPDGKLMQFHIFDIINNATQIQRMHSLLNISNSFKNSLHLVTQSIGYTLEDVTRTLDYCMEDRYEGVVLREINSVYKRDRSTQMMKVKPMEQDDYLIVGYTEECTIDKVPKDTLGSLILKGDNAETFNVGTGTYLTKDTRKRLWEIRESLPGMIATIKYQEITKARGVPYIPVLIDISTLVPHSAPLEDSDNTSL